ncbi:MAG: alpha/beta fold hydrolase [Armatimonadota bacterium]
MNKPLKRLLWTGAAVAVPVTVNSIIASRAQPMEQPLPGDIGYYDWIEGRVAFYRLGQGSPLLLVHNPNAAGSSWEWRKVFPELANRYTVYAIDLLGFGLSEKPDIDYSGAMLADLLHDFIQDVIGRRTHAVGSGLSSSYLVNAAVRRPEIIEHLVLVNPTGTTSMASPTVEGLTWAALRSPILGTSIYNTMVSMAGIENELLQHVYYNPCSVSPDIVQSLHASAHQHGSQFAAAAFISGRLDLPMRMAFSDISQPVLMIWGAEAFYTPLSDSVDLLYRHPQAQLVVLERCGMLPHDEKAGEFIRLVRDFLPQIGEAEEEAA